MTKTRSYEEKQAQRLKPSVYKFKVVVSDAFENKTNYMSLNEDVLYAMKSLLDKQTEHQNELFGGDRNE